MYNRYIPQPDGSYRRRSVQEQHSPQPQAQHHWQPAPPPCPPEPVPDPCTSLKPSNGRHYSRRPQHHTPPKKHKDPCPEPGGNVLEFLRKLLPKDFDTGDLLIILLLLLMSGDCQEDQNTALLTLALYLFL